MIFNSYLCHCPPSTHSYFFLYAAYALFFIRKIFKRTSNLAKKKKEHTKNIREELFFHCFYFPKSRKFELHNVLHGIRAH